MPANEQKSSQQIIAIGGGGFSTNSEAALDQYILDQSTVPCPRIGFIGTASGDAENYLVRFYSRFSQLDCLPSHLPLFRYTPDVETWIKSQDIIFVGGGNTKSMLAVWQTWNLAKHLKTALEAGTVLAGVSAGAICWFQSGITDSFAGKLSALGCLGFLNGSCCPHYSLEQNRKPAYESLINNGNCIDGYAIDDGAAIHFINGEVSTVISAATKASAYFVSNQSGEVKTEKLTDKNTLGQLDSIDLIKTNGP